MMDHIQLFVGIFVIEEEDFALFSEMETALLLKMAFSQRDRKLFFCRRSFCTW
jgi:hypothetical protein